MWSTVHADETYWSLDGERAFYWVHGTEKFIHFQFDTSRAGEVSRDVLGEHFAGTHEWLVFLDDPRVPPTNHPAERALRPLVVLRKLTFGHRTAKGASRMARIMTVQETAKRHGRKTTDIFYRLLTQPPDRVLHYLYAGG